MLMLAVLSSVQGLVHWRNKQPLCICIALESQFLRVRLRNPSGISDKRHLYDDSIAHILAREDRGVGKKETI